MDSSAIGREEPDQPSPIILELPETNGGGTNGDGDPLAQLLEENQQLRATIANLLTEREILRARIRDLTAATMGLGLDELATRLLHATSLAEAAMASVDGRRRYAFSNVEIELRGTVRPIADRLTVLPFQPGQAVQPEALSRVVLSLTPVEPTTATVIPQTAPARDVWERAQAAYATWRPDADVQEVLDELNGLLGVVLAEPSIWNSPSGLDVVRRIVELQAKLGDILQGAGGIAPEVVDQYVSAVKELTATVDGLVGDADLSPVDVPTVAEAQQGVNLAAERLAQETS